MSQAARIRLLPGRATVLGGLLSAAGACLVGDAVLRPGAAPAAGQGLLAVLCGGSGLILLCARRPGAQALLLALGVALLVAAIAIVGGGLTLAAGLTWGLASLVLLGMQIHAGAERQPALLLPACLALAGIGLGLALVEIRLSSVGALAYACAAVAVALSWACRRAQQQPSVDVQSRCGRAGILMSGLLGAWAALTIDPWQARAPSERFIIRYLESRQAAGERFDQDAFLRAFDTDEEEHAVVVGAGERLLHLFIARAQGGVDPRLIALLGQAVALRRLTLCIHPVAGRRLEADDAWVGALLHHEQRWAEWLGDPPPRPAADGRAPAADPAAAAERSAAIAASRAALAGTVRAAARLGVTAAPAFVMADAGATPRLLSPSALMTELQPAR